MAKETIFANGFEISSDLMGPETGEGVTTYQLGEHQLMLSWKNGQVETADAQGSDLETKVFQVSQLQAPDDALGFVGDGGIEEACIKCWRVGNGPWRCIPITCPAVI